MRRGLFMFLMLVLVLRGLTGTAMAAGLVAPLAPGGAHPVHQQNHHHGAVQVQDASGHHADAFATSLSLEPGASGTCESGSEGCGLHADHAGTCSACEICHSAMLAPSAPSGAVLPAVDPVPPQGTTTYHSAPAALTIKPPIA